MNIQPKKFGIISCCGSECVGGYITRIAAGKVIYELRSAQIETISLPRVLLGSAENKHFTRLHPTVTIDGCAKACTRKAVEKYSGKAIVGINVAELIGPVAANDELLSMDEFCRQYQAEIRKVTEVITYVIDTMSGIRSKSGCDTSCDCGCSSGSSGCGCSCEGDVHKHNMVELSQDSTVTNGKEIIIYTKTGCPFCAKMMLEYQEKGIAFREINISLDANAKQLCSETYGVDRVPIIVKGGVVVQIGDSDGKG
ncbi:glutaredoxin domain-containing protein [Sporomusa sp. GT1]|uniref:glutaredoxin domain-containing protein n=1 Tax=Sporomusa sp. GT1 TaxID=1534747 RepID=UPI00166F4CF1|nr:glutaredoxin domain-containing protein [Sporomusa sp. GT1]